MPGWMKSGGLWRQAQTPYIKSGGVWREGKDAWAKSGGVWRQFSKSHLYLHDFDQSGTFQSDGWYYPGGGTFQSYWDRISWGYSYPDMQIRSPSKVLNQSKESYMRMDAWFDDNGTAGRTTNMMMYDTGGQLIFDIEWGFGNFGGPGFFWYKGIDYYGYTRTDRRGIYEWYFNWTAGTFSMDVKIGTNSKYNVFSNLSLFRTTTPSYLLFNSTQQNECGIYEFQYGTV